MDFEWIFTQYAVLLVLSVLPQKEQTRLGAKSRYASARVTRPFRNGRLVKCTKCLFLIVDRRLNNFM